MIDGVFRFTIICLVSLGLIAIIGVGCSIYGIINPDKYYIVETNTYVDSNEFNCRNNLLFATGYRSLVQVMGSNGLPLHCKELEHR